MQRPTWGVALGHAVQHHAVLSHAVLSHAVLCHAGLGHIVLTAADVQAHLAMLQKCLICTECQLQHHSVQSWGLLVESDYPRRCNWDQESCCQLGELPVQVQVLSDSCCW